MGVGDGDHRHVEKFPLLTDGALPICTEAPEATMIVPCAIEALQKIARPV
jgi:hypothetical protein